MSSCSVQCSPFCDHFLFFRETGASTGCLIGNRTWTRSQSGTLKDAFQKKGAGAQMLMMMLLVKVFLFSSDSTETRTIVLLQLLGLFLTPDIYVLFFDLFIYSSGGHIGPSHIWWVHFCEMVKL
ncbi:hypothetical protein XENOCAPTIV_024346 [Xenoophorus captivus]|uniref:Uncharacterized protein n=1 Tax=Xenoophorus captivus TaxID=1517983 RepID=A0ABV0QBD4_9TELE